MYTVVYYVVYFKETFPYTKFINHNIKNVYLINKYIVISFYFSFTIYFLFRYKEF